MKDLLRAFAVVLLVLISFSATAAETVLYVHTDHLGSPIAYTDQDGNVVGREYYMPHGEPLNAPGNDGVNFTGHVRDSDTGLLYMQARYYDPQIGRFLSVDPVTFSPDKPDYFNRYWYAIGNPFAYTDPDGREVASITLNNDVKDLLNGTISKGEYKDRLDARGKGAAAAVGIVGAAASLTSGAVAVSRLVAGVGSTETMMTASKIAGASAVLGETIEAMDEISETNNVNLQPTDIATVGTSFLPGGLAAVELGGQAISLIAQGVEHYQAETLEQNACIDWTTGK